MTRIFLAAVLALPVLLRAQDQASIAVDAASSPGAVNPLVLGSNVNAADVTGLFQYTAPDWKLLEYGQGFWDPDKEAPNPLAVQLSRDAGVALLRYPGGSLVHNYDWRKAVGSHETRGNWKFGIDEYLTTCKAIGAEPMFTVSDYVLPADQMPANAAGLVEYLNSPATPDHPWAMKRKEWGHPAPYGVKWFELGNESDEGNMHVIPHRHYDAEQYAAYANSTAAAMRAVDPSIKIGIVMEPSAGTDVYCYWDQTVARLAGKSADYLIVHLYGPTAGKNTSEPNFFQELMAVADQSGKHLDEFGAMALEQCGRSLPVAITEYNGPINRGKEPYFYSYAYGLECADLIRVYLQPEHHVLGAGYWQIFNGPTGMVQFDPANPGSAVTKEPAYALYCLWAGHLGTRLAAVSVNGPRSTFAGAGSVYPATGDTYEPSRSLGPLPTDGQFDFGKMNKPGITGEGGDGGAFALRLDGVTGTAFPRLAVLPKPQGAGACNYELSFEARFVPDPGSPGGDLGLGLVDARGYDATQSAMTINGIGPEWKAFRDMYHAEHDTKAIVLQARLAFGTAKSSGRYEVRNLQIEAVSAPVFPAYPLLTACAMLSEDGKTLHLIVFNKSTAQDISAQIDLAHFHAASARLWEVNGPTLGAVTGVAETVHGDPLDMSGVGPVHLFPAHSMTAIDFVAQANPQNP